MLARYFICVSIKSFKKYFLKHVFNDIYDFLSSKVDSFPNEQWYEMTVKFVSDGMNMINISKINDKTVKKNWPTQFNKTEQILTVYTLTKTIRSKVFHHK